MLRHAIGYIIAIFCLVRAALLAGQKIGFQPFMVDHREVVAGSAIDLH